MEKWIWCVSALLLAAILGWQNRRWIAEQVKIFRSWWRRLGDQTIVVMLLTGAVLLTVGTAWFAWCHFEKVTLAQGFFFGLKTVFDLLEGDSGVFRTMVRPCVPLWVFSCILSAAVPILTTGTVLVLIAHHIPRCLPFGKKVFYIFSRLDQSSLMLARDLRKNGEKKAEFLFLRTPREEVNAEQLTQLEELRYRLYAYTEDTLLRRHFWLKRKKLRFFFLGENTDENFRQMEELLDQTEKRRLFYPRKPDDPACAAAAKDSFYQQELYLLSETETAPMLIDSLRKKLCGAAGQRKEVFRWTELRLLDRYRCLSYRLLQEKPLYETARNGKNRILILGFGRVGQALYRTLLSFSSMVGHEISYTLCDLEIGKKLDAMLQRYPECGKGYSVTTAALDSLSGELEAYLDRHEPETFTGIAVCTGDDERNISIAIRLKQYYRRRHWDDPKAEQPLITVNVEDQIKSDYTRSFFCGSAEPTWEKPLLPFGTDQDRFSAAALLPRRQWAAAQSLHKALTGKNVWELPLWSEYERRSSLAGVCHAPSHLASVSADHTPEGENYESTFRARQEALVKAEHQRWMDYVRTEGMRQVELQTALRYYDAVGGSHVDVAGGLTPCLVPFEELEALYEKLCQAGMGPSRPLSFQERDKLAAEHAAEYAKNIINT